MIGHLIDFVLNRQPVQAATGIAGVLIAALGLAHEFDVLETITVGQVTALGTFLTVLAGWLGHRRAWSPASHNDVVARVSLPTMTVNGPETAAQEESSDA